MPPETNDATTAPTYTFPFDIPDLSTASDETLRALHTQIREHAPTLSAVTPATDESVAGLRACRDLARSVVGELEHRAALAAEAADAFAELEDTQLPEPDQADPADGDDAADADADAATDDTGDGPAPTDPPAEPDAAAAPADSVTAASRRTTPPRVRDVARRTSASRTNPARQPGSAATNGGRYASMRASAEVPGFRTGQTLDSFAEAAEALSAVLDRYPQGKQHRSNSRKGWPQGQRPIEVYDKEAGGRRLQLRDFSRHSVVEIRREFPEELRVTEDGRNGYAVAQFASDERRLPGGNLMRSMEQQVKKGKGLTAAAGWCAPSDIIYDLLELESLDGLLDVPELQTSRGGWQIPVDGGPDFATIYGEIGNAGNTHLSETQVINDTSKVCTEIPCPDFDDVRLGVDYFCLTGGLLQRRGYPEVVARFGRAAVVALAHKINKGVIADMVTGSGSAITIPQDLSGDDAVSSILSGIELAVLDMKYRQRMSQASTMEVVLPWWVLQPMRAAMARRTGVATVDVTDAQILSWFTERSAVPRLVYDWQDAFSGLTTGPGGATALTHLPPTVQMLIFPSGTWVKAVQDVVQLDTIYDSTLLETNQYTAMFAEDGWAMLKMGPLSRLYTVNADPSGVVGCCDTVGS